MALLDYVPGRPFAPGEDQQEPIGPLLSASAGLLSLSRDGTIDGTGSLEGATLRPRRVGIAVCHRSGKPAQR